MKIHISEYLGIPNDQFEIDECKCVWVVKPKHKSPIFVSKREFLMYQKRIKWRGLKHPDCLPNYFNGAIIYKIGSLRGVGFRLNIFRDRIKELVINNGGYHDGKTYFIPARIYSEISQYILMIRNEFTDIEYFDLAIDYEFLSEIAPHYDLIDELLKM